MRLDAESEKRATETRIKDARTKVESAVKSIKEILPGIEVTEDERKDLIKSLTVPVLFTNKEGKKIPMSAAMAKRASNPLAFELRLAYLIKNGFFDDKVKDGAFNIFSKKVETSATKRLAAIIDGDKRTSGKPASVVDKDKSKEEKDNFIFPQDVYS